MFIRKTLKHDKKTGVIYASYQLVEAYRTSSGPRQRILLTIGSEVDLDQVDLKELANRIEEIYKGAHPLFPREDRIENLAQHFAKLLLQKNYSHIPENQDAKVPDYHLIDINSIQHTSVRSIGSEYVAFTAYQELGFSKLFDHLRFSKKQKEAATASIIGRAIFPSSERALHNRLVFRSGLAELLQTSFAKLSLDSLYHISDEIYGSKKIIEKHLREREKTLFDLTESIILYDITNTYFEGKCTSHAKAKRGKSKEMRSDCPLVSIGLVIDSEGFPKHSEIFEGNINERATLEEMLQRLGKQNMTQRPIIILDSGIATKDNVNWLKNQGYGYIVMMKNKDRPRKDLCNDIIVRNEGNQFISASLKSDEETGDNILWCYSEERLKKERDIRQHKTNALEKELQKLKEGLKLPHGRIKSIEKVHQKIGRLREKYARLAQHYKILVHPSNDEKNAGDITWTYDEDIVTRSFSGTYTLRTNVKELTAEKIWEIYVMLSEAESCIRCLKSEAGLRPNWHTREDRIDSHIFISILAYHLIATIRKRLKDNGINESWETIRERLQSHAIVATNARTKEGATIFFKQACEPNSYQRSIYKALGLSWKPIKAEKVIYRTEDVVSKI